MANIMRRAPFDVPEPVRRFLQGDLESWLRVEEYQDAGTLVVRAELPGIDPDRDVDITVTGETLTIEARREEKEEHRDKDGYRSEFRYGTFSRSFQLPRGVSEDDVSARYDDGLLEVRVQLPEQPPASGRKIRVDRPDGAGGTSGTSGNSGTAGSSGTQAPPTFGSGS